MMKWNVSPVQYKMFVATAFLVAAKSIELDERIPFISRMRRKLGIRESVREIRKTEIKILEACEWNPLFTTPLDILEFYLSQGILFSTDEISINQQGVLTEQNSNIATKNKSPLNYQKIAKKLKTEILKLSIMIVKSEELIKIDLKLLSAAAVAYVRKIHNITPVWNEELEIISGGLTMKDMAESLKLFVLEFSPCKSCKVEKLKSYEKKP